MFDILLEQKTPVDIGNAQTSCVPKKRKIISDHFEDFIKTKQHQSRSTSVQENDLIDIPNANVWIDSDQVDYVHNFLISTQDNYLYQGASVDPSLFTHGTNELFNNQLEEQLNEGGGFSSSMTSPNYLETNQAIKDQSQPIMGQSTDYVSTDLPNSDFTMNQMHPTQLAVDTCSPTLRIITALPDPSNIHWFSNLDDSTRLQEQQNIQYSHQLLPNTNLTSTPQHLDLCMQQTPQSVTGPEMVLQNAQRCQKSCFPQQNASNGSNLLHAQKLGPGVIQIDSGNNIRNVAGMNGKVYIAFENKDTLLVFSSNSPFQQEKDKKVDGMKHPRCMSACAEKNALFVSDGESTSSNCVWIVKDGDKTFCKKFVEDVECSSLSVTRNGELLIVDNKHACIHLYNLYGRCFCCVRLPDKIKHDAAQYAVKSLGESFYLSTVRTTKNGKNCDMVYEVSTDGEILNAFGGIAGSGSGQLGGSDHSLALDRCGRVIVGDERNDRILVLNSRLQLLATVLVKDEEWGVFMRHFRLDASADLMFAETRRGQIWTINIFSLSQIGASDIQKLSSNISSGQSELHLSCSIESEGTEEIRGVATLGDSIYVLTQNEIRVFNCRKPYRKEYKGGVGNDLWDIAASVSDKCLYVIDKGTKSIWSVGIDLRSKKWLEGIGSPYTLSVTIDGSVLMLSNKYQTLNIYNKDGLQRKIRISCNETMHLRHAVKLSYTRGNETYLVCHGHSINQKEIDDYDDSYFLSHEVFVVSAHGDIIQRFGGKFGPNSDQLNLPSHMVLFADSTILVADCNNNRVLSLNHQLKLQTILVDQDVQDIEKISRLSYNENTGQIIVSNSTSVHVFLTDDVIQCQEKDELSSSNVTANADVSESEIPCVQLIDQIDSQMLTGAAVLKDCIFLIYPRMNTVYVHSRDYPHILLNQVLVEETADPRFIVASVEHNCVYITAFNKIAAINKIWRLLLRNGLQCETFLHCVPK